MTRLQEIMLANKRDGKAGIYSCCSANRDVIRAAFFRARQSKEPVLIESTANQVNQFGGYTGMTPADFAQFVFEIADEVGIEHERIILGGDHLGPLPWAHLPEDEAMRNAEQLVYDSVMAGYSKLHLDTAMRLGSDDPSTPFSVTTCAARGARLAAVCEQAFSQLEDQDKREPLNYIVGSEVPVPGGDVQVSVMGVTEATDALKAVDIYREEFAKAGLEDAFERVVAFVLELGVEFHCWTLDEYDRKKTAELIEAMRTTPFCIEGHSTDYQTPEHLRQMCEDGVAILKVGPAFTFAVREVLFSLELIERELFSPAAKILSDFRATLDRVMCDDPKDWEKYYLGSEEEQARARSFSYYDRGRYYFGDPRVQEARDILIRNLSGENIIPPPLLSQHLPVQYSRVKAGYIANEADELLLDYVGSYIDDYLKATGYLPSLKS